MTEQRIKNMDTRLLAVIDRLSEDLSNMEKALVRTQELLRELSRETRRNGKIQATQRFLANQQPRADGAFPQRAWREKD